MLTLVFEKRVLLFCTFLLFNIKVVSEEVVAGTEIPGGGGNG